MTFTLNEYAVNVGSVMKEYEKYFNKRILKRAQDTNLDAGMHDSVSMFQEKMDI